MKNKKYYLKLLILFVLLVAMMGTEIMAVSNTLEKKKVVTMIIDEISLEELMEAQTPNIDRLMETGGIGFMNSRAKSGVSNRGSRFLSLGMGVRTLSSTKSGLAFNKDEYRDLMEYNLSDGEINAQDIFELYTGKNASGEIINLAIGDIQKNANKATPNNQVGLLGKAARDNNFKIGLVGNSDVNRPSREASLIGIDENGMIPYGYVGSDLLMRDRDVIGYLRLDESKLMEEVEKIDDVDILLIDYGDTVRIEKVDSLALENIEREQKLKAIERADRFLGILMEKYPMDRTLFIVLSANQSSKMVADGNFGLTPVIVSSGYMESGLLSSKTTRREGLVTNFDYGPTVINHLSDSIANPYIGEKITSIKNESPMEELSGQYDDFLYLRKYRNTFHWIYIIMILIAIVLNYLPIFTKHNIIPVRIKNIVSSGVFALPIMLILVSKVGYKNIVLDVLFVVLGSLLITFILNSLLKDSLKTVMVLNLVMGLILIGDTFFVKNLMIVSPLGSDAIAGGRFYGMGNDYMGIFLGSLILGSFIFFEKWKLKKSSVFILFSLLMLVAIVSLSPFVGANMGGTLSAMLALLIACLIIFDKKISLKKLISLFLIVVIGILLVAGLDILFNENPTHGGKALQDLLTGGGLGKLIEIISIKLRQVFWNLAYSSWNIVLFVEIILISLLLKFKKKEILILEDENKVLFKAFKIILFTAIAIFGFNDTGTIAAAIILSYVSIGFGMIYNN